MAFGGFGRLGSAFGGAFGGGGARGGMTTTGGLGPTGGSGMQPGQMKGPPSVPFNQPGQGFQPPPQAPQEGFQMPWNQRSPMQGGGGGMQPPWMNMYGGGMGPSGGFMQRLMQQNPQMQQMTPGPEHDRPVQSGVSAPWGSQINQRQF